MNLQYRVRTNTKKEYESLIHSYRVKRCLTVKELSKRAGVNVCIIIKLANGTESPLQLKDVSDLQHKYMIKLSALRIAAILKVDVEDLS